MIEADFGYVMKTTSRKCANPLFAHRRTHRVAVMKKEHLGSKGDREENGVQGWLAKGICTECGKQFRINNFYGDAQWQ